MSVRSFDEANADWRRYSSVNSIEGVLGLGMVFGVFESILGYGCHEF